jgi:hypothetical protein
MSERQPSVLLGFKAENARSFREPFELSLLATSMAEPSYDRQVPWREGGTKLEVLPAAGIFGANGSGKSNVLKVMHDMRHLVLHSFRQGSPGGGISGRRPYLLDESGKTDATTFEIDLVLEGVRHEYGFTFDNDRVLEEHAYWYPKGRAATLFERDGDRVDLGAVDRVKGRAVQELLRPNALFLSTAASANHAALLPLYLWFSRNLLLAEADSRPFRQALTSELLDDVSSRKQVLALLNAADLGVTDATKRAVDPVMRERLRKVVRILNGVEGEPEGDDGPNFDELGIVLVHRGSDGDVALDPFDESLGTRVWFGLIGPVVQALQAGSVFLADELDASLHPALVAHLLQLFQDPVTNPRRAQLIFNSHDVTLLGDAVSERPLGRDQIWFVEKRNNGSSRLYPLVDLDPRKQESIGKRYLAGRYGATPILSTHEFAQVAELITTSEG